MKASKFSDAQKAFILTDGGLVADICRRAGMSQATYFNWKKKYDGLQPPEMRRLKQLEAARYAADRAFRQYDAGDPAIAAHDAARPGPAANPA
jgi:transposase-like protein